MAVTKARITCRYSTAFGAVRWAKGPYTPVCGSGPVVLRVIAGHSPARGAIAAGDCSSWPDLTGRSTHDRVEPARRRTFTACDNHQVGRYAAQQRAAHRTGLIGGRQVGWREEIASALGEWIAVEGGADRQPRWQRVGRAARSGGPGRYVVDLRGSDIGPGSRTT
ncbi:hypothetical protein GCM10010302_58120 [Streptomyces polychromogenes]|uniref:Transposase n=1 Tax=Streptomyces polychromogenes TaxID=67342 RepID=A0ABN0VMW2_9ACTN